MHRADLTQEGLFVTRKTADYVPAWWRSGRSSTGRSATWTCCSSRSTTSGGATRCRRNGYCAGWCLQTLYAIRSERPLCEQRGYNTLY